MNISKYKNTFVNNLLLSLLFTGQFLALAFEHLLKISGLYFLIFAAACIYGIKSIIIRGTSTTVNSLDFFWAGYFVFFLISAGLFGHSNFVKFLFLFTSQAVIPFFLGRALDIYNNARKINFYLNLLFILYFVILIYLYALDPSVFHADRFYPFVDRSVPEAGGDPTQLFLGYGLAAIFLSNYFVIRSPNDGSIKYRMLNICIFFGCIILLMLVGSRSSVVALLAILIINEVRDKINLKKSIFIILSALFIFLSAVNFASEERLSFFSELSIVFDMGVNNLSCVYSEEGSILYRLSGFLQSLNLFINNPIFGVGVGNYGWFYCGVKGDFIYPHNIAAQILAEAGLIGLFIFIFCIFGILKKNNNLFNFPGGDNPLLIDKFLFNFWLFCFLIAIFSGNSYGDPLFYLLSGIVSRKRRNYFAVKDVNKI